MSSLLIHLCNGLWIVLVLVGVPAVTSLQLGRIQLSAIPEFQMLTLGGLGIGLLANLVGGWMARGKQRGLCWKWAFAHGTLLLVHYLVFNGHIHFRWLKAALLWLKKTVTVRADSPRRPLFI